MDSTAARYSSGISPSVATPPKSAIRIGPLIWSALARPVKMLPI
jgi:hypothetical protein